MILQALTSYYEMLARRGEISKSGWGKAKVSFALDLNEQGEIEGLYSLKTEQTAGKKTVLRPQVLEVPMPEKRTMNPLSNFLCDNSGYILGQDGKGKSGRTKQYFEACQALHQAVLENVDTPAAQAVVNYFRTWDPQSGPDHPALVEDWQELMAGANLVFWFEGVPVQEDPAVRAAWERYYAGKGEGAVMQCLVTGQRTAIPKIHPSIKGVKNAQAMGAALISFNAAAFCSYEREQNYNAPVGAYAAFAYTTALNQLLADREHTLTVGDTTVVCWAQSGEHGYQEAFGQGLMGGSAQDEAERSVRSAMQAMARGEPVSWGQEELQPDMHFYILGLSPNASRLSVRFFLQNSFGDFIRRLEEHNQRLDIVRPAFDRFEQLPLWKLLSETVNQKARDKAPPPQLAGSVLQAILIGDRYPVTLFNGAMLRIRAEREVTRGRAAILKAYYLRNPHVGCPEEVLTVALNESSTNPAYLLGRLFSILEAVQLAASPGVKATIKDKYFNSAASTPATIFPILNQLYQKHLRKLSAGQRIYYDKQVGQIKDWLGESLPMRQNLPEQASFDLGYYQQTQKRYEKKEETSNG